jgi:hypothetical protein
MLCGRRIPAAASNASGQLIESLGLHFCGPGWRICNPSLFCFDMVFFVKSISCAVVA